MAINARIKRRRTDTAESSFTGAQVVTALSRIANTNRILPVGTKKYNLRSISLTERGEDIIVGMNIYGDNVDPETAEAVNTDQFLAAIAALKKPKAVIVINSRNYDLATLSLAIS